MSQDEANRNGWLDSGYLNDVDPKLHSRVTDALNVTTLCLLGNREFFQPILQSSVDLIKKVYVKLPVTADVHVIADILTEYLQYYCLYIRTGVSDYVLVNEFFKDYKQQFLN